MDAPKIRSEILGRLKEYHQAQFASKEFIPGETPIPVSGKVFDHEELELLVDSSLDFWLTTGRYAQEFEKKFAECFGLPFCLLTNSGSSANLLALSALTSPKLKERQLRPGDEVITVAAGFPTTVNPILQNQLVPVFLDVQIPTYNVDVEKLAAARSDRTKAIMIAHTLGNPYDLKAVSEFAKKHQLWLIEDCCDAAGSTYQGQHVGTFGDLATVSFYPAHHITMGEGGAVLTRSPALKRLVETFRDWGRDCWCEPGHDNTCGKRFSWKLGDLPEGYDHKYTYSHIGYNLKVTDMQAAVGVAQIKKLPQFIEARKRNFKRLSDGLASLEDRLILPKATAGADPSWFGYPITLRDANGTQRAVFQQYLDSKKIASRLIFAGNLVRQPAYADSKYRVVDSLEMSDTIMNQSLWIGVFPGITDQMIDYMVESISAYFKESPSH